MRPNVKRALFSRRARGAGGIVYLAKGNNTTGNYQTTTEKYNQSTDTVSSGATWAAGRDGPSWNQSTVAGYVVGGYNGGSNTDTAEKMLFASEVVSSAGNAGVSGRYCGGFGDGSTKGIHAQSTSGTGTARKITYSSDTWSNGGTTGREVFLVGSASNATIGVWAGRWAGGAGTVDSQKYTFSSDTGAASTNFSAAMYICSGWSSTTKAYFSGKSGDTAVKIVNTMLYATEAVGQTVNLTDTVSAYFGSSNATHGLLQSNGTTNANKTIKYGMADDSQSYGTNLSNPSGRGFAAAPHSAYGGHNA